jgi:hypothetical protein
VLNGSVIGNSNSSLSDESLINISVEPAGPRFVHEWAAELQAVFVADSEG